MSFRQQFLKALRLSLWFFIALFTVSQAASADIVVTPPDFPNGENQSFLSANGNVRITGFVDQGASLQTASIYNFNGTMFIYDAFGFSGGPSRLLVRVELLNTTSNYTFSDFKGARIVSTPAGTGIQNIEFRGLSSGSEVFSWTPATPSSYSYPGSDTLVSFNAPSSINNIVVDTIELRFSEINEYDSDAFNLGEFYFTLAAAAPPTYTVNFNLNGGTRTGGGALTQTVNQGEDAIAPTITPPVGKVFDSWSTSFTNVQNDLTVNAVYTDATYTVTFNPDGGTRTGGGELTQTVTHGGNAIAPTLTRTGYTQNGWDASLTNITSNQTINAIWTVNNYALTYDYNYAGSPAAVESSEAYNTTINLPSAPTREHYDFVSWNTAADGSGTDYTNSFSMPANDLTLFAQWEIKTYTVTFLDHDNEVLSTQQVEHGSAAIAPADPTRTGYTFTNWDTAFDNITENTTVTAQYDINQYTVTLTTNEYLERGSITASASTVEHGASINFTGESGTYLRLSQTVGGTCAAGSWSGLTYTIASIETNCSVEFSYLPNTYRTQVLFPFNTGSYHTVVAPDGGNVYMLSYNNGQIYNYVRNDETGQLSASTHFSEGSSSGATDMQFLRDGSGAYIANHGSDRITFVTRLLGESGRLQYSGNFDLQAVGSANSYPMAILLSPDERFVYVHSGMSQSIYVLARNPEDNTLSYVATTQTPNYLDAPFLLPLSSSQHIKFAADGNYVLVASLNNAAVLVYARDAATGELNLVQIEDGPTGVNYFTLTISDDSRHVYVGSDDINGQLKAYDFDAATGTLDNYRTIPVDTAGSSAVTNLILMDHSQYLAVGKSGADGSFAVLQRDAANGDLTLLVDVRDGVEGVTNNMDAPESWALDPTSRHFYVATSYNKGGSNGNRMFVFDVPSIGIRNVDTEQRFIPGTPLSIFDQMQLSSPDEVQISAATIDFISGETTGDQLTAIAAGDIVVNTTATGLELENNDSLEHYQATLRSIVFNATSAGIAPRVVRARLIAEDGRTGTVTIELAAQTYTVTFELGDGTRSGGGELIQEIAHGNAATAPDITPPLGQDFDGWSGNFDAITSDVTISANYAWQFFTVNFDLQGGANISGTPLTQSIRYGLAADAPDVIRVGYTLMGWSHPFAEVTSDLDIDAIYEPNEYTITWDYNYAGAPSPLLKTYEYESEVALESAPARDSHSFLGWSTHVDGDDGLFPGDFTYLMPTDITLYAQWDINTYTVTFEDWDGGSLGTELVEHGSAATGPTPTRTGYTFTGWSPAIDEITTDVTVTAQYDINVYDVTFLGVDDVVLDVQPVEFGGAASAPEVPFTPGYLFQNWDQAFNNVTGDLTVRAEFQRAFMVLNYPIAHINGVYLESDTLLFDTLPMYVHTSGEVYMFRAGGDTWYLSESASVGGQIADVSHSGTQPLEGAWTVRGQYQERGLDVRAYQPALSYQYGGFSTNNYVDELDARGMIVQYFSLDGQGLDGVEGEDLVLSGKVEVIGMPAGYRAVVEYIDDNTLALRGLGRDGSAVLNTLHEAIEFNFEDSAFIGKERADVWQASTQLDFAVHGYFNEIELTEASTTVQTMSVNLNNLGTTNFNNVFEGVLEFESGPNTYAYVTQSVQVSESGDYLLGQLGAPLDTVMLLYRDSFDPQNPRQNLVSYNDDWMSGSLFDQDWDRVWLRGIDLAGCPTRTDRCPVLQHFLEEGVSYVMVISHFSTGVINNFELPQSFFVHGNGEPFFTRTVSLSAGANGSVPGATVAARTDLPFSVTVTPDVGYQPAEAVTGSCPAGTWAGNVYTIDSVQVDCSIGFSFEPASFTLTIEPANGDAAVQSTVTFGEPVSLPAAPSRDWYNFVGWNSAADGTGTVYDADFTMPSSDLTLYAQWAIQTFTVRFLDWDGAELSSVMVDAGSGATAPSSPSRIGYTFVGWDVAFDEVYSALDVTAQYDINTFTVRFLDWDGAELSSQTVNWNSGATAPADPEREGYSFTGWSVAFDVITANLDVTAQYDINTFTVRFLDWDGAELSSQTVNWNSGATAPADPTRDGHTFTGWSAAFDVITANLDVTAQYDINTFTVRFLDYNGDVLKTETVDWNSAATAPADPEREGYGFTGWSVAFDVITANLDVTAEYDINTFTVRFLDYNGDVLKTETVDWNNAATAPADPERELYEFIGWDRAFDAVTSDMDITAQYERNAFVVTATVITVDGFGVVTPMVQQVPRGGTATFEAWTSVRYRIRSVQSDCGVTFERTGRTYQFDDIRQDCEVVFEYRKVRSSIIRMLKMHGAVIQEQDDEMPGSF